MRSFLRLCLFLLLSASLTTSCKKPVAKQTKFISKSAVFVATLNSNSLQKKLVQNQGTIENIIRNFTGNDTTVNNSKREFEELKASGIDLDDNLYIALMQRGGAGISVGQGAMVTSAIASLKDADKLVAYIKKKQPNAEVRKEKDYDYTTIHDGNLVAWGKDVVIMLSYQKSMSPGDMEYDSTTGSFSLRNPGNAENELKTEIQNEFNLKEDQSIASIPEFRDLMQEKSDASMWVNSSASLGNLPLPLPKLKELFGNSYTAAKVEFEDGKILVESKSYYSPELKNILKNYSGSTADLGLIEAYPSDNINAFGAFSFNPQVINGIVQYLEMGGMVDEYLSKMMGANYTLQDALKAIKGDFAVIVSDFSSKVAADSSVSARPSAIPNIKMLMNIPVGDRVQMNRLMDKLVEMQLLVKSNNQYALVPAMQRTGFQLSVDDKNIFITSDQSILSVYKARAKKANIDKNVMASFKDRSGIAYVNIESILNGINGKMNVQGGNILPDAKATFKDMTLYTNNFNGKFVEGHGELKFKNEKENSLTSLLKFMEVVSKNVHHGFVPPNMPGDDQPDTLVAKPKGPGK